MRLPLAACFILLCLHLNAQTTYTSNGVGGGDWDTNTTWSPVGIPGSSDEVIIADGDVVSVTGANKSISSLAIQGTGNLNFLSNLNVNVSGDLTMSGSSSITGSANGQRVIVFNDFNVPSGTATLGGFTLQVINQTTLNGTLTFDSNIGVKSSFAVLVDGGTINYSNNEVFSVTGTMEMRDGAAITGAANGHRVDIAGDFNITSGTVTIGGNQINANGTTNINGTLEFNNSLGNKSFNNVVIDGGTVNFTVSELFNITNDLEMRDGAVISGSASNHRVDIANEFNITSGTVTIGNNQINANGTTTINGTLDMVGATGNKTFLDVVIDGGTLTFSVDETFNITNNLEMRDGGQITGTGNNQRVDVANEFNVTSGVATIGGIRLNANGNTTVDGTLSFSSIDGNKTFNNITVSGTGTFDNSTVTESFDFNGDLVNNGTWNGCSDGVSCLYDLNGASNTLSGSGTFNISDIRVPASGNYTNNGTIVLTDNLTGTGTFINGATGVLELRDNGNYNLSATGTLTLNTVGNIVRFAGGTTELITLGPFYNLEVEMDNSSVICQINGNDVTVEGDFTVVEGLFRIVSSNTLDVTGNATLQAGEILLTDASAQINVGGNLNMTDGEFDINDGGIAVAGDVVFTGGLFNKNHTDDLSPSTLTATNFSATNTAMVFAEGEVTLSGDLTLGTGATLLMNQATSELTITGDFDVSGSGEATLNSGTTSFSDMELTSGGAVELGGTALTSTGTITVTNGSFTIDGVVTPSFNNISVGASGVWNATAAYDPTINGNLHNIGTFTGCNGNGCDYTLTSSSGTITGSGAFDAVANVILNDGASYTNTNTGGFNASNALRTDSGTGTFINGANGSLIYGGTVGNFTVTNFTANATNNTVTYNRTASIQRIMPTTDNVYHNLVIDKADGVDMTTTEVFTFNGDITLNDGDLIMGNQDIILGIDANIIGGSTTGYIQQSGAGRIRKEYTTGGNTATINIPFGDATAYAPMTFALVASDAIPASAEIEFEYVAGAHPDRSNDNSGDGGDDDGTAATDYLNAYWNFTSSTISNPTFNATLDYTNVGATGSEAGLQPFLLRTFTPEGGGSTIDWFGIGSKPAVGSGTVNPTSNIVTFSNVVMGNTDGDDIGNTSNSVTLYAMDNSGSRLPITLIDFTAKVSGSVVQLDWSTASETNNEYFTIERSSDGSSFHPVLTVDGAGNSSGVIDYQAIDPFPMNGRTYYRLKQTDFNGQFEYSKLVAVDFHGLQGEHDFALIKNPVQNGETVYLEFSESLSAQPITVQMINGSGRVEQQLDQVVDSTLEMHLSSPKKSGLYIIQVISNQGRISKKLIVQ
ncbi:T9SS type A sorting domain-containing protein [Roseivirga pacifica]|uniref:T9SS type A sorting domain-containing protein n=1 Tax=Roseivirga pacifica TaxID=1267423 RepID=UPI003BAC663C